MTSPLSTTAARIGPRPKQPASAAGRPASGEAAKRARLVQAATRMLAERGLEGINSNSIARAAGLGVGTFYSLFRDKHELVRKAALGVLERVRERLSTAVARADAQAAESARARGGPSDAALQASEQVRALVVAMVEFAADHPEDFVLAFGRERRLGQAPRATATLSTRPTEQGLASLAAAGVLDPGLDHATAAAAFHAMQAGLLLWWLEDRSRASREQLVDTLVRLHPAVARAQR